MAAHLAEACQHTSGVWITSLSAAEWAVAKNLAAVNDDPTITADQAGPHVSAHRLRTEIQSSPRAPSMV